MYDYILNELDNQEVASGDFYPQLKHFYALQKREYVIRLFLAIAWSKYFDECNPKEKTDIFSNILGNKPPALGVLVDATLLCCKYASKDERKRWKEYGEFTKSKIIFNRNSVDHANLSEINKECELINSWINKYFSELLSNTRITFVIPHSFIDDKSVKCIGIDSDGKIIPIIKESIHFGKKNSRDTITGMLYYSVEDTISNKENVYRLSPFVHYYGYPIKRVFTFYLKCVGRSTVLETQARSLFDDTISDEAIDDIIKEKTCRHEFNLKDFLNIPEDEMFSYSAFCNTKVNKSSYKDLLLAANNSYKYSENVVKEYCDKVEAFCNHKNSNYFIIAGTGGVGKTALLLNIVQKLLLNTLHGAKFDKLIFLSAKKLFLNIDTSHDYVLYQDECDIYDYESLRKKILLYLFENTEIGNSQIADDLCELINSQEQSVLLMIDDFDSFDKDSQEKTIEFISKLNPAKMKTIITTRNMETATGYSIVIERFNRAKCIEFAEWIIENYWESISGMLKAQLKSEAFVNNLVTVSRGIPIFIRAWIKMVARGKNAAGNDIQNVFTERDCIRYLYNTAIQNLDENSVNTLHLLNKLKYFIPQKGMTPENLFLLSTYKSIEECKYSLKKLIEYALLEDNRDGLYELYDFDYSCILPDDNNYYELPIFKLFFEKIRTINDISRVSYIDVLIECLEEYEIVDFSYSVILEKLLSEEIVKTARQSSIIHELMNVKDSDAEKEHEMRIIMGDSIISEYNYERLCEILENIIVQNVRSEAKIEVLSQIVSVCNSEMDSLYLNYEDESILNEQMVTLFNTMKRIFIPGVDNQIKDLRTSFRQKFIETFEN